MLYALVPALIIFCVLTLAMALRAYRPLDLPPTRNGSRRFLPVIAAATGVTKKTCRQCYSFEPSGFGELARRVPAAAEAARWLAPGQMASVEKGEWTKDREDFDHHGQPTAMGGPSWDELGICHARPGVMTFPDNTCEKWQ
jgi:hypothetical protein